MFHWQDVRYALGYLTRTPFFSLVTMVVLGGGLGLSVFTFSFLHTAMLRPLPVSGGERIVRVDQVRGASSGGLDAAVLATMRPGITTLTDVTAYDDRELIVGADGEQRRALDAVAAEWRIFEVTGTRPALGRGFRPDDQAAGADPVAVLSDWAWRVAFGADTGVVNSRVTLNGVSTLVVGVMPPGYGFPVAAEAWVPLSDQVLAAREPGRYQVSVFARLAPHTAKAQAEAELAVLFAGAKAHALPAAVPEHLEVRSFPMAQMGEEGPLAFVVLNLLAGLILLLACVNVTNLLLARANERARETAVRLALGASRSRLIVQNLWESVILCTLGAALAVGIAGWGLGFIDRWAHVNLEGNLAFWWVWRLDRTAILAAVAFAALAIAGLGGAVAARAARTDVNAVLQDTGARAGGRGEGRVARLLVITQVATVSVLMFFGVMSGIVAHRVAHIDPGYNTRDLLSSGIELPPDRYATRDRRDRLYRALYDGLTQRPQVDGVVLRAGLADRGGAAGAFEPGGRAPLPGAEAPRAYVLGVLGPLSTMGVALQDGRLLDPTDRAGSAPVAVVSRALAARHWPGTSPVGRRIRLTGLGETGEWRTVVGVVGDVLMGNPLSRRRSAEAIYLPLGQSDAPSAAIVFRHRGDAVAAQAVLHEAVAAADPLLVPATVQPFQDVLDKVALLARSVSKLFALCFGFALLLAVTGTYALMARAIGQRTREVGVRRALGATDRSIVRLLLGQGGRQLGIGALVALPVILVVGVGFSSFVPIELVVTMGSAILVTAAIGTMVLAATYLPARRALAVPPREALGRE